MDNIYTWLPVVVDYEIKQKREEGCKVSELLHEFNLWLDSKGCSGREAFYAIRDGQLHFDEDDLLYLESIYSRVNKLENSVENNSHPVSFEQIMAGIQDNKVDRIQTRAESLSQEELYNRIYGEWLGRAAGCVLGKPVELWNYDKVTSYLKICNAYPLDDYIPEQVPMPQGYVFKEEYKGATKGDVNGSPRDDDMDYPILNLNLLEKYGTEFTTEHVGMEWLRRIPYKLVYTAERVAYKNLINGLPASIAGSHYNPYREWIGAQIRADIWGWANPGLPGVAVELAYRDGILTHSKNGLYGELWVAAMLSIAFVEDDVEQIILKSLNFIPQESRLAKAILQVIEWSHEYADWKDCFTAIQKHLGSYHIVHTINNAAIVAMSLLYSKGDYHKGITIAVMAGWDTDCNGATVGSVLGVINGADRLPAKWIDPLQDRIRTMIYSDEPLSLSGLAKRTCSIAQRQLITHAVSERVNIR